MNPFLQRRSSFDTFGSDAGFTLMELLVTIAIVSTLASVILTSLGEARDKSADARRMEDLRQIAIAMNLYYYAKDDWMRGNSGCGFKQPTGGQSWTGDGIGDGNGFFNLTEDDNPAYDTSIAQCLLDAGVVTGIIQDPSGGVSSDTGDQYYYMKCTCDYESKAYIFARLEGRESGTDTLFGMCCGNNYDTSYGMNYVVEAN